LLETRPESLTSKVYETIRKAIIDKSLPPGTRLTEASLADQLDVSKTPVREALMELRNARLIEEWGRRGGRVVMPSREVITEVAEVREAVDVFLAAHAAESADPAARARIGEAALRSRDAAETLDQSRFDHENFAFHLAVAEAVGNRWLIRDVRDALTLSGVLRLRDFPLPSPIKEFAEDHLRIAEAIRQQDSEAAATASRRHVRRSLAYNLAAFQEFQSAAGTRSRPRHKVGDT
jgi:DNA-binding GntR family transcriptional regulator